MVSGRGGTITGSQFDLCRQGQTAFGLGRTRSNRGSRSGTASPACAACRAGFINRDLRRCQLLRQHQALSLPPSRGTTTFSAHLSKSRTNHRNNQVATSAPADWATRNKGASAGRIPAKVLERHRAIVTAGFANEVEAVTVRRRDEQPIAMGSRL